MTKLYQKVQYQCDICNAHYTLKKSLKNHKKLHTGQLQKLSCENCEYETYSRQCLNWHKKNNHIPKIFSFDCKVCPKVFAKESLLNSHIKRQHHQRIKTIKCKSCDKAFQYQTQLRKHTESVHLGLKKECDICKGQFSDLNRHKMRAHSEPSSTLTQMFKCNHCEKVLTNKQSLTDHMRNAHTAKVQCEMCNQLLSHLSLKKHIEIKHNINKPNYKCPECQKQFASKDSLNAHINYRHKERESVFCGKCDYRGRTPGGLKKHSKAVHEGITHDCNLCDYKASFKENLYRHMRTTHKQGTQFSCNKCKYATFSEETLRTHTNRVHLKLKTSKCEYCDYSASRNPELLFHIKRVHLKIKQEECNFCEHKTLTKSEMRSHINRMHLMVRSVKCNQCDYSAVTRGELTMHNKRKHQKESIIMNKCKVLNCEYKAITKSEVMIHFKRCHSKSNNYSCQLCGYSGHTKENVRSHMNNVHKNIPRVKL